MEGTTVKDLYIIGAGDTGRELVDLAERINLVKLEWSVKGFIDDNTSIHNTVIDGVPVLGGIDYLNKINEDVYAICAVGNGITKKKIIESISNPKVCFATLIDPNVVMCHGSECGEGSFIYANCALAINVKIGKHVYLSFNCSIGHDTVIEDYCSAFPGVNVSGKVVVKEATTLGTGTKIIQGKNIAPYTIIGAGSVVVKNLEESGTYVGVPVKKIK